MTKYGRNTYLIRKLNYLKSAKRYLFAISFRTTFNKKQ